MAGKPNILKQLFIQIGLIGDKDAVKGLKKVEKQTDKNTKAAQRAVFKTNKYSDSLSALGVVGKSTSTILKMLGGTVVKGFTLSIRGAVGVVKMLGNAIKGLGKSLLRVVEIAAGIQLSNLISSAGNAAKGFATTAFDLAVEESTTKQRLRENFEGDDNKIDQFIKAIGKLEVRFGTDANALASALASTSINTKKLLKVGEIIAKIQIKRPEISAQILAGQIQNMLFRGDVDETLKAVAPQLLSISREERMANGIERLQEIVKDIGLKNNKSLSFSFNQLKRRAEEFKRTFTRPIIKVLEDIFGELVADNDISSFANTGTAIAQTIRLLWNTFFKGTSTIGPLIQKADKFLGDAIRWIAIVSKDIFDFLTGAPSAIQKIFFPDNKDPTKLGLKDLLSGLFFPAISLMFDKLSAKVKEETGFDLENAWNKTKNFFNRSLRFFEETKLVFDKLAKIINVMLDPAGAAKTAAKNKFQELWEALFPAKATDDKLGKGQVGGVVEKMNAKELAEMFLDLDTPEGKGLTDEIRERLEELLRSNTRKRNIDRSEDIQERLFPDAGSPDLNDQGAINFNTDIKITTQQPANVVRNQLANQMALIGNQGRLA